MAEDAPYYMRGFLPPVDDEYPEYVGAVSSLFAVAVRCLSSKARLASRLRVREDALTWHIGRH
eukprot:1217079-Rhodomonas_salina.3